MQALTTFVRFVRSLAVSIVSGTSIRQASGNSWIMFTVSAGMPWLSGTMTVAMLRPGSLRLLSAEPLPGRSTPVACWARSAALLDASPVRSAALRAPLASTDTDPLASPAGVLTEPLAPASDELPLAVAPWLPLGFWLVLLSVVLPTPAMRVDSLFVLALLEPLMLLPERRLARS